jgi:hypothetical protein
MAGPAAVINFVSGAPQSVPINAAFGAPLVVQVVDANGNPVSGVTVTFLSQGRDASASFAGGVNTAVTNGLGIATSPVITANGIPGNYVVQAWLLSGAPIPGPSSVGPATFWLSNNKASVAQNVAAVQAAWTTAKANLATTKAAFATLLANLLTNEGDITALSNLGATDVSEWLRKNLQQMGVGNQPFISPIAGAYVAIPDVFAIQPGTSRDLTNVDARPISSTLTGATVGLS